MKSSCLVATRWKLEGEGIAIIKKILLIAETPVLMRRSCPVASTTRYWLE
jgi:hypothetical protein